MCMFALTEELHQFDRLGVWELVDKPFGKTVIGLKWLWKNKKDEENIVIRNKPDRFVDLDHPERVFRLRKAHYGLKQAPKAWYDELSKLLILKGFTKGRFDIFFCDQLLVFQQHQDESLYDSWTHFKDVIQKVPNHGLSIWTLIEIFLKHLNSLSRHIINLTAEWDLRKFSGIGAWYLGIDDPKRHYGFKPSLLGKRVSLGVDISNWEMFDDDRGLKSKEVSPLGEELSLFDRPNEVKSGRILEAHRLESIFQQQISQCMAPSHHDSRKAHLVEDKQISSVGVFDEVYLAFGRHLEEIHVTWAHLEKKRMRLRTYTNISQDYVLSD
ncbi:ribonuclease H-like domain-containing protein [Tanacetum coccineum]